MEIRLLPGTIDENGRASVRQHFSCLVIDEAVAVDAGSLAQGSTAAQRRSVRDVVLTHAHLDHIAGLPLFVDDLFATLTEPITVHATAEVIEVLERDIFNWSVYPRFSELSNDHGTVLRYEPFRIGEPFRVRHLEFLAIGVNHKVPSVGFLISDGKKLVATTGDTAGVNDFWDLVNSRKELAALFIECAFPNELTDLAMISHHLTPAGLQSELAKLEHDCPVYVMSIKPAYYDLVVSELKEIERVEVFGAGRSVSL